MRTVLRSPFVAALIGGAVVAVALLAFDVGGGTTTTIVQQAPVASTNAASSSKDAGLTAHDIYTRAAPGVLYVRSVLGQSQTSSPFGTDQGGGEATGTGFVIDGEGHILTNYHVVEGATSVSVGFDDQRVVPAKVLGTDPTNDLALLSVDPAGLKLVPLQLGDSRTAQVGDPVLAIGNPFGLDRTLTTGVVSALQREITAPNGFAIQHVIQTDAPINPGNSGGPLLDDGANVIGVNSQIATAGIAGNIGIGFAIPSNTVRQVAPRLEKGEPILRPWLGVITTPASPTHPDGAQVSSVVADGPSAKAGVHVGDVIKRIDGTAVQDPEDVANAIAGDKPGQTVTIVVERGGATQTLHATLGKRPTHIP